MLLRSKAAAFGFAATPELPNIWAALMELKVRDAKVSLVTVVDGTTSLYFSTGGGMIGGGEHEKVRTANRALLRAVQRFFEAKAFAPQAAALPTLKDAVTFNVLTYDGIVAARDAEKRLLQKESPLWPLYYLGQDVITQLRTATQKKPGD